MVIADTLHFTIFFSIFFQLCSDLLSFSPQSLPLFFLSSLPYCCISVLSYPYPASPIQHWFPVGLENLSFRGLLFSPDKLAVKASSLWVTLCIILNLIDPFCQRAFISIMCLFSLISVIRFLCMSYCIHRPLHAVLKCLGNGLHLLQGEESLCPSLLHPLMWDCISVIRTQLVHEDWYFSFF